VLNDSCFLLGLVMTTRITHATPAALYTHTSNRDWECDSKIPGKYQGKCKDITRQLIEDDPGRKLKVSTEDSLLL